MTKHLLFLVVLASVWAGGAQALPITYTADLSGAAEDPPNASPGTGLATVIYDPDAHTLKIDVDFENLIGTTTVAHIHCCVDAPGTVGVAVTPGTLPGFPAGVTSGSYLALLDLTELATYTNGFLANFGGGTASGAETALVEALNDERAYFNIHTSFVPAGEIRGFLAVPEPATLSLLGLGLVGLFAGRRVKSD